MYGKSETIKEAASSTTGMPPHCSCNRYTDVSVEDSSQTDFARLKRMSSGFALLSIFSIASTLGFDFATSQPIKKQKAKSGNVSVEQYNVPASQASKSQQPLEGLQTTASIMNGSSQTNFARLELLSAGLTLLSTFSIFISECLDSTWTPKQPSDVKSETARRKKEDVPASPASGQHLGVKTTPVSREDRSQANFERLKKLSAGLTVLTICSILTSKLMHSSWRARQPSDGKSGTSSRRKDDVSTCLVSGPQQPYLGVQTTVGSIERLHSSQGNFKRLKKLSVGLPMVTMCSILTTKLVHSAWTARQPSIGKRIDFMERFHSSQAGSTRLKKLSAGLPMLTVCSILTTKLVHSAWTARQPSNGKSGASSSGKDGVSTCVASGPQQPYFDSQTTFDFMERFHGSQTNSTSLKKWSAGLTLLTIFSILTTKFVDSAWTAKQSSITKSGTSKVGKADSTEDSSQTSSTRLKKWSAGLTLITIFSILTPKFLDYAWTARQPSNGKSGTSKVGKDDVPTFATSEPHQSFLGAQTSADFTANGSQTNSIRLKKWPAGLTFLTIGGVLTTKLLDSTWATTQPSRADSEIAKSRNHDVGPVSTATTDIMDTSNKTIRILVRRLVTAAFALFICCKLTKNTMDYISWPAPIVVEDVPPPPSVSSPLLFTQPPTSALIDKLADSNYWKRLIAGVAFVLCCMILPRYSYPRSTESKGNCSSVCSS